MYVNKFYGAKNVYSIFLFIFQPINMLYIDPWLSRQSEMHLCK